MSRRHKKRAPRERGETRGEKPHRDASPSRADRSADVSGKSSVPNDISNDKFAELNDDEKKIIELLKQRNYGADELARTLGMKISELNNALVSLEIRGAVARLAGNSYKIM